MDKLYKTYKTGDIVVFFSGQRGYTRENNEEIIAEIINTSIQFIGGNEEMIYTIRRYPHGVILLADWQKLYPLATKDGLPNIHINAGSVICEATRYATPMEVINAGV